MTKSVSASRNVGMTQPSRRDSDAAALCGRSRLLLLAEPVASWRIAWTVREVLQRRGGEKISQTGLRRGPRPGRRSNALGAMQVTELAIPAVKLIVPRRFGDRRGFFSEVYNIRALKDAGITESFVQDNHSLSAEVGTVRGLHFQSPPHAQAKLLRVSRGRIFDVAVDLRRTSPTFGKHVTAEISADNWAQIFIPAGFAHGFCTLEPDTEVIYKVSDYYAPEADAGILWSDADLGIDWPVDAGKAILSDKDKRLPAFKDLGNVF